MKMILIFILCFTSGLFSLSRDEYDQFRLNILLQEEKNIVVGVDPNPYPEIDLKFNSSFNRHYYSLAYPTFFSLFDIDHKIPFLTIYKMSYGQTVYNTNSFDRWSVREIGREYDSTTNRFAVDLRLNYDFQSFPDDYYFPHYNRGHLVPHKDGGDFSNVTTNIAPQIEEANSSAWNEIENLVTTISQKTSEMFILTGTAYPYKIKSSNGSDAFITIPQYFYKIILIREKDCFAALSFLMTNRLDHWMSIPKLDRTKRHFFIPFNELENGLDFILFPHYKRVEQKAYWYDGGNSYNATYLCPNK